MVSFQLITKNTREGTTPKDIELVGLYVDKLAKDFSVYGYVPVGRVELRLLQEGVVMGFEVRNLNLGELPDKLPNLGLKYELEDADRGVLIARKPGTLSSEPGGILTLDKNPLAFKGYFDPRNHYKPENPKVSLTTYLTEASIEERLNNIATLAKK